MFSYCVHIVSELFAHTSNDQGQSTTQMQTCTAALISSQEGAGGP